MTYEDAREKAVQVANRTEQSVIVYRSTLNDKYGVDFTLPIHGCRVGDRVYPIQRRNRND